MMPMRFADGACNAAVILQRERAPFQLQVNFGSTDHRFGITRPIIEGNPLEFDQFVTALQENPTLQRLCVNYAHFHQRNDPQLERLFGQVLLRHSSLTKIEFEQCWIATEYVVMLAGSVANRDQQLPSLQWLVFSGSRMDNQGVAALANYLLRANVPIEHLALMNCGIDSAGCLELFQALGGNTHFRDLDLSMNSIREISLTGVQALARSNLRTLNLSHNDLRVEAISTLVQGLRVNFTLENLQLCHYGYSSELFEELLTTFNFSLRVLEFVDYEAEDPFQEEDQQELNSFLRLNDRVRSAHNSLENHHNNYTVPQRSLWPDILERISSKPSLLYRFVRQGNLDAFSIQVLRDPIEGQRLSSRRKRPMNPSA